MNIRSVYVHLMIRLLRHRTKDHLGAPESSLSGNSPKLPVKLDRNFLTEKRMNERDHSCILNRDESIRPIAVSCSEINNQFRPSFGKVSKLSAVKQLIVLPLNLRSWSPQLSSISPVHLCWLIIPSPSDIL